MPNYLKPGHNILFLDTETTGLDYSDQVIEIAICDIDGNSIFHSRCRPTVEINAQAQSVHGITTESLSDAPTWIEIEQTVFDVLTGPKVIIFNKDYDLRIIQQTSAAFGLCTEKWLQLDTECAMLRAASIFGATNRHGTIGLANAILRAGIEFVGTAHSALGDAATTAALWRAMDQS